MSQHSRVSSQSSRSNPAKVQKRILALNQALNSILDNNQQLKKLSQLNTSLPEITNTDKSLKQIQKHIDNCSKELAEIHSVNQKNSSNTQTTTMMRVLKTSSKNANEMRHSIKELFEDLTQSRRTHVTVESREQSQCKNNVKYFVEKNKKEITAILKKFEEDCLQLEVSDTGKQVQRKVKQVLNVKRRKWEEEIKKMNMQVGSIKCEAQFIKDRRKKILVEDKLKELTKIEPILKDKELVLSIAQEEIQLYDLSSIITSNTIKISKELASVQTQLNSILQFIKQPIQQQKKQHITREILYLNDRWFKLKNVLRGYRKRYMISMRDIEERFISINNINKGHFSSRLKALSEQMAQLHKRAEQYTKQFNIREDQMNLAYKSLQKLNKEKILSEISEKQQ